MMVNTGISSFAKALLEQPDQFAQLKYLSLTRGVDDDDCQNVDFKDTLPRGLQYLKIHNYPDYCGGFHHFITSPEFLPPSLTHLDIHTASLDVLEGHGFPSTLTLIHVECKDLDIDWMELLPAGLLKCFVLPYNNDISSASYDWTALPRGLTALSVFLGDDKVEAHHLKALPPGITDLYLSADSIDTDLLPLLPPSLKTLNGCLPPRPDSEVVKKLPRSITDLEKVLAEAVPFLPPSLKILSLKNSNDALLAPLPRSLKTLKMSTSPQDAILQSFYPPTLTSLKVNDMAYKTEFFSAFPPTLSILYLRMDDPIDQNSSMEPIKKLSSLNALTMLHLVFSSRLKLTNESSSWLPRSLEQLIIEECKIQSDWFSSLPSSLINLNLTVQNVKSDAMKHLERCCPQLKCMTLTVNIRGDMAPDLNSPADCLLNLPRSLTECEIRVKNFPRHTRLNFATNEHLRQLPSSLTHLRIPASEDVTSGCLPFLPKSLSTFIIEYGSPHWFIESC